MDKMQLVTWSPFERQISIPFLGELVHKHGFQVKLSTREGEKMNFHFENCQSYFCINETFSEEFWSENSKEISPFYKNPNSDFINFLKQKSEVFRDCVTAATHYIFVTQDCILHVIADCEPVCVINGD